MLFIAFSALSAALLDAIQEMGGRDDGDYKDEGLVNGKWGSAGAGILFSTGDRVLLLERSMQVLEPMTWSVPGGAIPVNRWGDPEPVVLAAEREAREELGDLPPHWLARAYVHEDSTGFRYTTLIAYVPEEFVPKLNEEHSDYRWVTREQARGMDLHPGMRELLEETGPGGSVNEDDPFNVSMMRMYHGRQTDSLVFDAKFINAEGNLQDGPGFYLTNDPEDARRYAEGGIIIEATVLPRRLVPHEGAASRQEADRLLRGSPNLREVLEDWDEDPRKSYRKMLDAMMTGETPWAVFQNIWYDGYHRGGYDAEFARQMVLLGYDAAVSPGDWGGRTHLIVYNPQVITRKLVFWRAP